MRINGQGDQAYVEKRPGAAGKSVSSSADSLAPLAGGETTQSDIVRQHASELQRLRALLDRHPAVREELLAEVRSRLNSGHYDTAQAAIDTAGAILRGIL